MNTDTFVTEHLCAGRLRLTLNWANGQLAETGIAWADDNAPPPSASEKTGPRTSHGHAVQDALRQYAAGRHADWPDLPLALEDCTPFTRRVLELLRTVPAGSTVTYGQLAAMAGRPGAARGVGQIMRRNRWPLLVPCHRVVGGNGKMTGFSGTGGIPLKEYLLRLEGALPAKD
ncbi:methylated-DNA--[protein]-cysteine S-methyltransferase [Desulfovibrio psychrotolerans]|uniref:Methylated-DNA--protein-cysteine methyltransferase n=1 Tax=Desulfovibrio psychrotolerans TaxID=415242 RepID=A0A7J0BTR1_9BACT|nr:MGMT family protein [Desulfovibrio psychrotolerans]GFM37058.1 methylated-DNA--protein-cysteine methyltransferase [Desulfovibrio psychrotolerans]